MAGGDDLGGERRVAVHLLADQKERGRDPGALERRKDGRGALRMRTVVEGQRDPAVTRQVERDPVDSRERCEPPGQPPGRTRRRARRDPSAHRRS